jgi:hypothetical protein
MIELLQHAVQPTAQPLVLAHTEDLSDLVGGQTKDA